MRYWTLTFYLPFLFVAAIETQAGAYRFSTLPAYNPGIIIHPRDYNGTGGPIQVSLCIDLSAESYRFEINSAIQKWNALNRMVGNCEGCQVVEETPFPEGVDLASTTILHELGHCAFGLGHPNLTELDSSYSTTREYTSINAGADLLRGTRDDVVSPLPGARILHWFRVADNDPFVVDSTVINQATYTRQIVQLPSGSLWPANGNLKVGEALGYQDTQAVMYAYSVAEQRYLGLAADDVNTAKMAMTGLDLNSGTADDYTIQVVLTSDCAAADIVAAVGVFASNVLGACSSNLPVLLGSTIHYRINGQQDLEINEMIRWDVVFADSFETGATDRWF